MDDVPMPNVVVMRVRPGTREWGTADSERWRADLFELQEELQRAVPHGVEAPRPADGAKGLEIAEIIISLGSAGVFTAALEAFKAWLGKKPDRRTADIDWSVSDREGSITLDATNLDSDELTAIIDAARGGPPEGEPAGG